MRWSGRPPAEEPQVRIGEVWYRPLAIDGLAVEELLAFCDQRWPGKRAKRFGEDLVEAMVGLGWEGDAKVDLKLARLGSVHGVGDRGVARPRTSSTAISSPAPRGGCHP